jgi:hypothetical protein
MSLLSGLESLGLGSLENVELYEKEEAKERKAQSMKAPVVVREVDMLFDKTYTCSVCDHEFKTKTVRAGKARLLGTDADLRPRYENIDLIKYDVVACPMCGYAALSRYFKYMTSRQLKLIRAGICANYKPQVWQEETYSYDEALRRYKLTLANAIVKQAKASEKAYICLKSGWLLRGMRESLKPEAEDYEKQKSNLLAQEKEYLQNALEGFVSARQTEGFPMCGMDETTVDYLIAMLAMQAGQYDLSMKMLGGIITSGSANRRIKDKARDAKELLKKMKDEQQNG